MKSRWKRIAGFAALLVALLVVLRLRSNSGGIEVDATGVTRQAVLRSTVTASGEIVATRYADLGSSVMGRVVELPVAEGDEVEAGRVVARIDPVQAQAAADSATAQAEALAADERSARQRAEAARSQLEVARARDEEGRRSLERARQLHGQGLLSDADLDAAQASADAVAGQLAAAQAEVTSAEQVLAAAARRAAGARAQALGARDLLAKTEILAPIAGRVTRLNVRQGEMVVIGIQNQPGTTLMTLSDLASLHAEVKVAEADVLRLALEQPAVVTLEALPGESFPGRVREIGASALPVAGTGAAAREFRVLVELESVDARLRPGLTCDAEIVTAERGQALTVPLQAVVLRPGTEGAAERTGVFAVENDRARFVPVTTGIIGGLDIQVEGIEEGTPVVVGPFQALRELADGARLRVTRLDRR